MHDLKAGDDDKQRPAKGTTPDSRANQASHLPDAAAGESTSPGNHELRIKDYFYMQAAYLAFRLPFLFMLPMSEAPDEFAHYWVIKFLKEHWRLPNAQEVFAGGASAVYGSLPQLGYIPHIVTALAAPPDCLALAERLGSIIMGSVMLFSAFKIAGILFPRNRLAALALPAAVICHPQMCFIHAYANNDSTSSALASLLMWLMLETATKGLRFKRTLLIGALAGWLALTKYSGLAVLPVVGLVLIASIFIHGTSLALAAGSFVCAGLLALFMSAWWFVQNAQQYAGDFMGTKTMYNSWARTFHHDLHYYLPPSHIIKSLRWWRMSFFSFWGLFGYMNKYLWRPVYFGYLGMVLAAVLGGLNGLRHMRMKKPQSKAIVIWSSLALVLIINLSSMIWASVHNLGGPQGRYLITSEIPIMALIIGGLNQLGQKWGRGFILAFLAFNAIVSLGSWIYLFHLYHGWHLNPLL